MRVIVYLNDGRQIEANRADCICTIKALENAGILRLGGTKSVIAYDPKSVEAILIEPQETIRINFPNEWEQKHDP